MKYNPIVSSVVKYWLSAMANFVKDSGAICRPVYRISGSPPSSIDQWRSQEFFYEGAIILKYIFNMSL